MPLSQQMLTAAVYDFLSDEAKKKINQNCCGLSVKFRNPALMDAFQSSISPIMAGFKKYDNRLIAFYPSREEAQRASNNIENILMKFNDLQIEQAFKPDWLPEYLNLMNFGIESQGPRYDLTSPAQIESYLERREASELEHKCCDDKIAAAKAEVANYSVEQLKEDFAQFIEANWDGFRDGNHVRSLVDNLVAIMKNETQGECYLSSMPAFRIYSAIKSKDEYLTDKENDSESQKLVSLRRQHEIENKFSKLTEGNTLRESRSRSHKLMKERIKADTPNIAPKGLALLLNDSPSQADAHTPFKGLDLSYNESIDVNHALSLQEVGVSVRRGWRSPDERLADVLSDYYFELMRLKQESKFESLLVEHSKVLSEKPFFDHLLDLAAQSHPDYEQEENNSEPCSSMS